MKTQGTTSTHKAKAVKATSRKRLRGHLVLVHWDAVEAARLAAPLQAVGWRVSTGKFEFKDLKAKPPAAMLISLRRLPSHGREVADALWFTQWGRAIPIVFFDGATDKIVATRRKFPTAQFARWEDLPVTLEQMRHVRRADPR